MANGNVNLERTLLKLKNELVNFKFISKSIDTDGLYSLQEIMNYLEVAECEKEIIFEEVSNFADSYVFEFGTSLRDWQNGDAIPIDLFCSDYGFVTALFMTNSKRAIEIKRALLEDIEWNL